MANKVVHVTQTGDFQKTNRFLHGLIGYHYEQRLKHYGEIGVQALQVATPKDTGKTSESWSYEIVEENGRLAVYWKNSNVNKHVNIAVILQYGHATRNGGWVEGVDYINPALKPIFDKMAKEAWKELIG